MEKQAFDLEERLVRFGVAMIRLLEWLTPEEINPDLQETQELIRIFVSSVHTARTNGAKAPRS